MSFITPTFPPAHRRALPPRIICGRKPRRRPKNPPPTQIRPLPTLPPLPKAPLPTPPPISPSPSNSSKALKKTLKSRRDAIVLSATTDAVLLAALSCRENSEHALILLPTRAAALDLAALLSDPRNVPPQSKKTRVIVAAGNGPGSWAHPAMNANSSTHSVIVVGTPRAIFKSFFNTHGLPWLQRVRFFASAHVSEMLDLGCARDLDKIIYRLGPNRKTVVVEREMNDEVKVRVESWVREKYEKIEWGDIVTKSVLLEERILTAGPVAGLEYLANVHDTRGEGEQIVVLFPAARVAEAYATMLRLSGRVVLDIHSKTSVANRARALQALSSGGIVLGTDTVLEEVSMADMLISFGYAKQEVYERRRKAAKRVVVVLRPEVVELAPLRGAVEQWEGGAIGTAVSTDVRIRVDEKARRLAYQALLTIYAGLRRRLGWNRQQLVEFVNGWSGELFKKVPEIDRRIAGRKRLLKVSDVRIREKEKVGEGV